MTILQTLKFTCPLCGNVFESRIVESTNSFGRLHSDLYREAEGVQPICYFVHTCPGCGYTGYEGDFQPQEFNAVFKDLVAGNITPEVKDRKIDTNGNFYLAALCAEWRGAPLHTLARIYHMGAWCCRIRGEKEKEKFYLFKAAEYFEKALSSYEAPPEEIALFTYLVGDLYRRLGDTEKAREWYEKVEQAIKNNGGEPKMLEFARRQLSGPSDIFS
jgi:hypothetical protein